MIVAWRPSGGRYIGEISPPVACYGVGRGVFAKRTWIAYGRHRQRRKV